MDYLADQDFQIIDWPAQSLDLNPIENMWQILGSRVMSTAPKNTKELWELLQAEWNNFKIEECQNLIRSCVLRCKAVIKSKGRCTKY